tara:strand:- start:121 stop:396 length:276 start_codon:yes stop_codon:yes gene_type:complete
MSIHKNYGSFLDSFGCVLHKNDDVFRSMLSPAKKQYEATQYKGLILESINQDFLIGVEENFIRILSQKNKVLSNTQVSSSVWKFFQFSRKS